MGETRERLTLPLLRTRLTEEGTGLVARAWQPWFEAQFRTQTELDDDLAAIESDPQQGDVAGVLRRRDVPADIPIATEHEARRLATGLAQVDTFSDVPQVAELVRRAFAAGAQLAAGEGAPPASQALNLDRRDGDYYRRWALAI
jgi:hypothetical protein